MQVGQRVHCRLYGGRDGIIYGVRGTPNPSSVRTLGGMVGVDSGCRFDVVFEDGSKSPGVPECIVRGVQWRILDEPLATAEEIAAALQFAEETLARKNAEKEEAKRKFQEEVERLRADPQHAHLKPREKGEFGCEVAVRNIRIELKKLFPKIKFSVRKKSCSSVWISWKEEELNQREVSEALDKYTTGYYDQLSDCHLSEDSPWNVVFGGVEYMTCQRSYS